MQQTADTCPNCGGHKFVTDRQTSIVKCAYCGSQFSMPKDTAKQTAASAQVNKLDGEISRLVKAGQKLEAVKLAKEELDLPLKDAMLYVNNLTGAGIGSAGKGSSGGCLWVVALFASVLIATCLLMISSTDPSARKPAIFFGIVSVVLFIVVSGKYKR